MSTFLSDYDYNYPDDLVALYPLKNRDASKLLFYNSGNIEHRNFKEISDLLTSEDSLFFNNSKVVPARLNCERSTGASIEVFLLNPVEGLFNDFLFDNRGCIKFKTLIGNKKRLKNGEVLKVAGMNNVSVQIESLEENEVSLLWSDSSQNLSDLLSEIAKIPLPPYIKREVEKADEETYQTIYGEIPGSVASTTAGLHFTPEVLQALSNRNIQSSFLTLHVGAGTFLPVKVENVLEHDMHYESFIITEKLLSDILSAQNIVAVGTTSLRALESIYWLGIKLYESGSLSNFLEKEFVFEYNKESLPYQAVIQNMLDYFKENKIHSIVANTGILILPGYQFKVIKKLITNFHQPKSTLIMLVAAFIGEDWRKVYTEALKNRYRLFSYGDASLLVP